MLALGMTPFSQILIALQDEKACNRIGLTTVLTGIQAGVVLWLNNETVIVICGIENSGSNLPIKVEKVVSV